MSDLSIENVINISVSQAGQGVGQYNTSNLAIFTKEVGGSGTYDIYLDPIAVGVDYGTTSETYKMALAVFSQQPSILTGGGYLVVINQGSSETIDDAITRTVAMVQYFGIMTTAILVKADLDAAAAVVQALNKISFFGSRSAADIAATSGMFWSIAQAGQNKTRCLYYGTDTDSKVHGMVAAYASRALSTNFAGVNTTSTMHLKDLVGVVADPTITQAQLTLAEAAGADCYPSIQGVPKVFTSGKNGFFDDVYNLCWFVGDLQVAGFNALAQTSTKIAQTEAGVDSLKSAYRVICEKAVNNQYVAAGRWTSPNIFGNTEDFYNNISERGYYIYSLPVALQSSVDRAARICPLIQIAIKASGAVHSSFVLVNVNA